jgi:hypothetical protein
MRKRAVPKAGWAGREVWQQRGGRQALPCRLTGGGQILQHRSLLRAQSKSDGQHSTELKGGKAQIVGAPLRVRRLSDEYLFRLPGDGRVLTRSIWMKRVRGFMKTKAGLVS